MNASSGSHCRSRRIVPGLLAVLRGLLASLPGVAQPISAGVAWLAGSQRADGRWESAEAREVHATGEALRALQARPERAT